MIRDSGLDAAMPHGSRAWFTVAVVFLAYVASFIDRTVLTLLVTPIKSDLQLSDVQISLVGGLAFGLFYAVMGLPLGWIADRRSRRALIVAGVTLWSMATVACGVAQSFEHLFAARVVIGIGEAALAPAALSLIAASFPPERRALPVAVFVTAGSIGGGLAMILGGRIVEYLSGIGAIDWPVLGELQPWQSSFVLVGLAGLPVAVIALAIQEPVRVPAVAGPKLENEARPRWVTLIPLFAAMTFLSVVAYGYLAWIPEFFRRQFGWSPAAVGTWFGLIFLISGAVGALAGGALAKSSRSKLAPARQKLRIVATGLSLLVVPAILAPLSPSAPVALVALAPVMFLFAFPSGVAVAAVQDLTPENFRGRVTAFYYLVMNLFGLSTGGTLVAVLSDSRGSLGEAMAILGACTLPLGAGCAWYAWRTTP